jgi:hypothetical protein
MLFSDRESCLVDLDGEYIVIIENWANVRRQVIQSKLGFTTLVFAILALVASTKIGDTSLDGILNQWNNYQTAFQGIDVNIFGWVLPLFIFLLAITPLIILFFPFSSLISESCILDFIIEGCAWARSVQKASKKQAGEKVVEHKKTWFEMIIQCLSKLKI